ncbi:MAG: hypothetical protein HY782_11620 [Chloroflexi bacterium]|nr:hypothetical protein [Chloroflexota bacterium]
MIEPAPAALYAGSDMALNVQVSCPSNCNLQGSKVTITSDDGAAIKEIELVSFGRPANETDEFIVRAPTKPGEYTWTAVFAAQEQEGVLHEECSTSFSFVVKPHTTSIAVWDVPSPIVFNTSFTIKVGVQCSAECELAAKEVAIHDDTGVRVATGTLGDAPWSDTGALYWAEIDLKAPSVEGYYTWEAKFSKPDMELGHEGSCYPFGFRTATQPDHVVTVEVLDKVTKTPIKRSDVILHPYRGYTDERGVAMLTVPKGDYELYIMAAEKQSFQTTLNVAGDVAVRAELLVVPVEDTSG